MNLSSSMVSVIWELFRIEAGYREDCYFNENTMKALERRGILYYDEETGMRILDRKAAARYLTVNNK